MVLHTRFSKHKIMAESQIPIPLESVIVKEVKNFRSFSQTNQLSAQFPELKISNRRILIFKDDFL